MIDQRGPDQEKFLSRPADDLTVGEVRRLLQAIEAREYEIEEGPFTTAWGKNIAVDSILSVDRAMRDGRDTFKVTTAIGEMVGNIFHLELRDGRFVLVAAGTWVS